MEILNHKNGIGQTFQQLDEYFNTHLRKMEQLIETIQTQEQVDEYQRMVSSAVLDANGNGTLQFDSPMGFGQKLERISVMVPSALAGNVTVYSNVTSPGTLLEVITTSLYTIGNNIGQVAAYSDAFSNNLYVGDQEAITVQFSGFTAGAEGYVNIQSKIIRVPTHVKKRSSYFGGSA